MVKTSHKILRADGLSGNDAIFEGEGRLALVAEVLHKSSGDGDDIIVRNAKRSGRQGDLLDEVSHLVLVELHELVHLEHTRAALVSVESCSRDVFHSRASQEQPEVLVEMLKEFVLRCIIEIKCANER